MNLPHKLVATGFVALAAITLTGAAILAVAPVKEKEQGPLDKFRFVAFDGFDGALRLNWKPVRPDDSHVSLKKNPGKLTITTQRGTIHAAANKNGTTPSAKNIYVIDNPLAKGGDFVVTTCIVDFAPTAGFQQAGLILYDDDNNYLKFVYQYDWRNMGGANLVLLNEQNAVSKASPVPIETTPKRWLRFMKKGNGYEFASSADGDRFNTHGVSEWSTGGPKQIGIIAKNGGTPDIPEIDAQFEFFELKAP